jgi:hypothetical protein
MRTTIPQPMSIEPLHPRHLLSAQPIPITPLPAVTVDLTSHQVNQADAVIDWNATALKAIWNAATPPTTATRVLAMVGVAVYDSVEGLHSKDLPIPIPDFTTRPPRFASPDAAAIAAADEILTNLYPAQQSMFDAEYAATLASLPDTPRKTAGVTWGRAVADALIVSRTNDGATAPSTYTPAPAGGTPGTYELTPGATTVLTPQWGDVTPWGLIDVTTFRPAPPPALDSAQYAADFNYTKSVGGTSSTTRTDDQTQLAHFWADLPGHGVTPPGHWDEIAEHLSLRGNLTLRQNAKLFGVLNIGLADAAICCWDAKYLYNFWRPVTAINDPRASTINPATSSDPTWRPLWNTPNFPSYTSGHSTFSGAADSILTAFFGRKTSFTMGSDDMPGVTRRFASFTDAADEAGESRIFGGIHFEFDNQAGLTSGRALGAAIAEQFLK